MRRIRKETIEISIVVSNLLLILSEVTIQSYFQEQYFSGKLTETQAWLADNFFNHIGNSSDGFFYVFGLVFVPELIRYFSKYKDNETLAWFMRFLSVAVIALIGLVIVDAETTQNLTGIFRIIGVDPGISDVKDVLAGFYGILAGISVYDLAFGFVPKKDED